MVFCFHWNGMDKTNVGASNNSWGNFFPAMSIEAFGENVEKLHLPAKVTFHH